MKQRKKGNIILLGLALLIAFLVLFGIYLNVSMSWESYNRVQTAIEEGAKVRAQAVDMYLKEISGVIEAYHEPNAPSGAYGTGQHPDIDHHSYLTAVGHVTPYLPNNEHYQAARRKADTEAKQAILDILNYSLQNTNNGSDILMNFSTRDICIQVKPLPKNATDGVFIDFSCTTENGDTVEANNIRVTPVMGSKGPFQEGMNRQMIFDPDPTVTGDELIHEVVNVVFVGASYEHRHFIETLFPLMNRGADADDQIDNVGRKNGWAIAYPQIDKCFGTHCAAYE